MLLSRWVMMNVVLSSRSSSRACCISYSVWVSTLLVESSMMSILGFFRRALAMATLCFCPPERVTPLSPTLVS